MALNSSNVLLALKTLGITKRLQGFKEACVVSTSVSGFGIQFPLQWLPDQRDSNGQWEAPREEIEWLCHKIGEAAYLVRFTDGVTRKLDNMGFSLESRLFKADILTIEGTAVEDAFGWRVHSMIRVERGGAIKMVGESIATMDPIVEALAARPPRFGRVSSLRSLVAAGLSTRESAVGVKRGTRGEGSGYADKKRKRTEEGSRNTEIVSATVSQMEYKFP
uniref:Mediator of RNA polymerase II transcription subunit 20 n=1 Tax=Caenorhabditis tropicalis TaxID=1561998 RepID=A0A1I7UGN8_9PELO